MPSQKHSIQLNSIRVVAIAKKSTLLASSIPQLKRQMLSSCFGISKFQSTISEEKVFSTVFSRFKPRLMQIQRVKLTALLFCPLRIAGRLQIYCYYPALGGFEYLVSSSEQEFARSIDQGGLRGCDSCVSGVLFHLLKKSSCV